MRIPEPIQRNLDQNQIMQVDGRVFRTVAAQFGGNVTEVSQYMILRKAVKLKMFPSKVRNDMSSGLAIQWIKERIDDGNLLTTILAVNNLFLENTIYADDMLMIRYLITNIRMYYYDGLHHSTFTYHLKDFVTPSSGFVSAFPYADISRGFKRNHYHIILFGKFAMAAYVDQHGKMDLYNPSIGEARGLRTSGFVRAYILNLADAAVAQGDPTLNIQERSKLLCDAMVKRKIVVLSYS